MRGPVESDPHDMEDESFPPLPPPHSPGQGGQEDGDPFTAGEGEDGDVSKLAEVPAAKRKGVKRPQPKLDSQRLISDRGLPALRTLFDNVHFKGKGHEASDLRLLMQKMENWAHRLFPKLQFEDFIDRLEKLGNKKEVQTCLKRIRLDMPLTHEDFMGNGEEEPASEMQMFRDPDPFSRASVSDDDDHRPIHSTPAPTPTPTISSPPAAASLTEEQQRRIELNKQRALERRLARQQQQQQLNDSQTEDEPTLKDEPASGVSNDQNNQNDQNDQNADVDRDEADLQPELNKDSEPSAETGQGQEEEEEGGMKIDLDADLQPSSKSEDADEH